MTGKKVIKAHRGFAHVPLRGRRRPPIQQPTGRRMTPAQRDAMRRQRLFAEARRRRFNQQRRGQPFTPAIQQPTGIRRMTPSQRDRMIKQMEEARRRFNQQGLNQVRRRRRPTGTPVPQPIPEPMQRPTGRRVAAKGKFITKKNIGANDYRQGGYVLSTVDNRKNKK